MEMLGKRELAVSQQQAWDALNDPEVLKACIPGCDRIEATGQDKYSIAMALKIGPVSAKFAGNIALSEIQAPNSYKLNFDGQGGAAGFGKGESKVTLTPLSAASCELNYTVNASVGGKIAQLGQRLIDGASKSIAEDFFKRFEALMVQRHPQVPDDVTVIDAASAINSSDSNSANNKSTSLNEADSSKGLPIWLWGLAAGVCALVLWWVTAG